MGTWADSATPLLSAERPTEEEHSLLVESTPPPSFSDRALAWDVHTSSQVFFWYKQYLPGARGILLFLEFTGHGVPWIIWPLLLFFFDKRMGPAGLSVLFHFYLGTVLDLAAIGIIKPLVRRQRPAYNPGLQVATVNIVDQYSFPSGHASRAWFVTTFVFYIVLFKPDGLPAWMRTPFFLWFLLLWAVAIVFSRVALGRHHMLDVILGALLGASYVIVLHIFWIPDQWIAAKRDAWIAHASIKLGGISVVRNCAVH